MIKYYKLFDLLNRRGMKKSDLREIISSRTVAKLSKGENVNTEIINKICLYLECQPGDIMEVAQSPDEYLGEGNGDNTVDVYMVSEIDKRLSEEMDMDIINQTIIERDTEQIYDVLNVKTKPYGEDL